MKTSLSLTRVLLAPVKSAVNAGMLALAIVSCLGLNASAATVKTIVKANARSFEVPSITSFAPNHGPVGTVITVSGSNLGDVTTLSIGSKAAQITAQSATSITATVLPGTVDGKLTATNSSASTTTTGAFLVTVGGSGSGPTAVSLTAVNAISPSNGPVGSVVTITGSFLKGMKAFSIGGKPGIIISDNENTIVGIVGPGSVSGTVSVTNVDNTVIAGSASFTVAAGPTYPLAGASPKFSNTAAYTVGGAAGNTNIMQGYSVAISADGNTTVLGAPNYAKGKGALIVFAHNTDGTWAQQGPVLVNTSANLHLGINVFISVDGNTILSGSNKSAYGLDTLLTAANAASILYTRSGNTWAQTVDFGTPNAVALSGDGKSVAVGHVEPGQGGNRPGGTSYDIFKRDSTGSYNAKGTGQMTGTGVSMAFSLDGHTLLFGSPYIQTPGRGGGATFYGSTSIANVDDDGNSIWGRYHIQSSVYHGANLEGTVVAISGDGKRAIIGGQGVNALTYTRTGDTSWVEGPAIPNVGAPVTLNIDGTVALISQTDGANFYRFNGSGWIKQAAGTTATTGATSVALTPDGTKALIGFAADASGSGTAQVLGGGPSAPVVPAPTVPASALAYTNTTSVSTTLSWTKGNGTNRAVFIAKTANGYASPVNNATYIANTAYSTGSQVDNTGWYCVYNGTGATVNITGLLANTTYRATIVEYNGTTGTESYSLAKLAPASVITLPSSDVAPNQPSINLAFTQTTSTGTSIHWQKGNGASRAVFIAKTTGGFAAPVTNTTYTANTVFASGTQVGTTGWYCIYNGKADSAKVSGLLQGTTYRVTIVEYNGAAGAEKYSLDRVAPANVATIATSPTAPTQPSVNLAFSNTTATATHISWTSGNGSSRAVFFAKTANGFAAPVNNTAYTANTTFGTGTQVGSTGWYCIYNGTGNGADVSGLQQGTTYRVTIVEYNGTGATSTYSLNRIAPANVVTTQTAPIAPTTPAFGLSFTNTTSTGTTINWSNGNGASRAVFLSRASSGYAAPADNATYTASTAFGSGTVIGGTAWYCIYNGTGSTVNVSNLVGGQTYRVTIVEYNGAAGTEKYTTNRVAPANVVTLAAGPVTPTAPAYNLSFTNTTNTATTVNWTNGNGAFRAVFAARTSFGYAAPVDLTDYTASLTFASGAQIGSTGWYCVYNGSGSSVTVTGLSASQTYRFTIVEYNANGAATAKYSLSRIAPANVVTLSTGGSGFSPNSLTNSLVTDDIDTKVVASNLLSPNGDGKNDTWIVKNIDQYPNNTVTVYDQANGIVFNKKGYANDWAGTYAGGVLKEGTYYYLVDLGNGTTVKGFVTVLRNR